MVTWPARGQAVLPVGYMSPTHLFLFGRSFSQMPNAADINRSGTPPCMRSSTRRPPCQNSSTALAMATSTNMSTTDLDRLRCSQCSKAYKEVKLLNRHRRGKHSQKHRLPCDYPGCSVNFQCLRCNIAHMKKQHADHIARIMKTTRPPPSLLRRLSRVRPTKDLSYAHDKHAVNNYPVESRYQPVPAHDLLSRRREPP
jgi:hypothetical protein